ncbi:hypothetical protein IC575_004739 [Cucumis melo]
MFLLYDYDIFWVFLIISSVIPILAFLISEVLAPLSKEPEKLSSYEFGIEPIGNAWVQFRIRYYMFPLVFVVFDFETVFRYLWAMSFDVLRVSVFIEDLIFVLILIVGLVYAWRKGALEWSYCCFIEFTSLIGSRFDFDCFGLVPRSNARQAYLILIAGMVTMKMAPSLVKLYEQTPKPKYVIVVGACTITEGMFSTDSYSIVRGVDTLILVDLYLSGCRPKPEAVIDAITKLCKKVSQEIYED